MTVADLLEKWRDDPATRSDAHHSKVPRLMRRLGVDVDTARQFAAELRREMGRTPASTARRQKRVPPQHNKRVAQQKRRNRVEDEQKGGERVVTGDGRVPRTLDDLLRSAGVDRERWIVKRWVTNRWGSDDAPCYQTKAWLERRPSFSTSHGRIRAVKHLKRHVALRPIRSTTCALIVPDLQAGHQWSRKRDRLEPLHDRRAADLAVQVAARLDPDVVVLLGDMLDLAAWSTKYRRAPGDHWTTTPTLAELHWWLGQLRLAAPGAKIVYLEGNHEERITKAVRERLSEVEDLRPPNDCDGPDLVGVERMLALRDLDIEYVGPYDTDWWLDGVACRHGETVRKGGGSTAAAIVRDSTHSVWFGHVHRRESAARLLHGPDGVREIWAASPGTLARVDGAVPAATSRVDWQQGLGVQWSAGGEVWHEIIPIQRGACLWRGELLAGEDRGEEIRTATGWDQL